jgi:putative SOS response-associated peptidase YedK
LKDIATPIRPLLCSLAESFRPFQGAPRGFARADGAPVWFAGLWDRCTTPDAGEVRSFTIMTGTSAGVLSDYHDRAPVVLDPADWGL